MRLQTHPDQYILAVGNIVTSPYMRKLGVRGIGTALSDAAARIAAEKCKERGGKLIYSVAEAEPESLGFWRKRGFLWPQGVQYLQPSLEFDEAGSPVHKEMPETLLLAPTVEPEVLRDVIRTIYENWCLSAHRSTLPSEAMRRAESYVMEQVFDEVNKTIPNESIPLVDSSLAPARTVDSAN
jgi:hypothetical protein